MGCWSGTCGITRLPIIAGDPIRVVVIAPPAWANKWAPRSTNVSGYCYSHGMYSPKTLFIKGEYDDYGGIENIQDDGLLDLHDRVISQDMATDVPGDTMARYDGKPTADMPLAQKLHLMERERFFTGDFVHTTSKGEDGKPVVTTQDIHVPVGIWMVREDVVQGILTRGAFADAKKGDALLLSTMMETAAEMAESAELTGLTELEDAVAAESPTGVRYGFGARALGDLCAPKLEAAGMDRTSWWDVAHILSAPGERDYGSEYGARFFSLINASKPEEAEALLRTLLEWRHVVRVMSAARIGFHPQSGKGSQTQAFKYAGALASIVKSISDDNDEEDYV